MNTLIFASCVLALAAAEPGYLGGAHLAYNAVPVAAALTNQYHAQDELGQYSYGYSGDTSAKHETRTLDGITRGGYSYLDANGLVQSANYVSDPVHGFRVAATNLPVGPSAPAPVLAAPAAFAVHAAPVAVAGAPLPVADTPEVVAAKLAHYQAHAAAAHGHLLGRKRRSIGHAGVAGYGIVAAPAAAYVAAPARSFAYSTVAAHAAPAVAAYAPGAYAAAPAVVAAPARSFAYSTVAAHAAPAVAAYGPGAYAAAPAAVAAYAAAPAVVATPARSFAYSTVAAAPLAAHAAYAAPVAAPLAAAHVAGPVAVTGSSQYHAQDELGQYSYGYADGNSVKHESRAFDGTTHGAYSYVDGHGLVQSVKYHADALGFRAVGTNIPVAH